jgi:hypothetical protein
MTAFATAPQLIDALGLDLPARSELLGGRDSEMKDERCHSQPHHARTH